MPQPRRTIVIFPPDDTIPVLIDVFEAGHHVIQGRARLDGWIKQIIAEELTRERPA